MPCVLDPVVVSDTIMIAAMPAQSPEITYSSMVCRRTCRPASRAASGLPPMANVRRPNVVRLSSTHPTATTAANR